MANPPIIATGAKDNTIRLWNSQDASCISECTGHTEAVGAVAFSRRNLSFLVSGSSDKTIKLWSLDGKGMKLLL
jgi:U3 small nucleolar RNA-associated protein 13